MAAFVCIHGFIGGNLNNMENTKEANFMQVGQMSECGHCNPKFAEGMANVEKAIPDYKCECKCHTKEEWEIEFDMIFLDNDDGEIKGTEFEFGLPVEIIGCDDIKSFIRFLLSKEKARVREELNKMKLPDEPKRNMIRRGHIQLTNRLIEDIKEIIG